MRIQKFAVSVLLTLLLLSFYSASAAAAPTCTLDRDDLHRQSRMETQAAIDRIAASCGAAGVQVAVVRNGQVDDTYVFGSAEKDAQPMTVDTKFRVASLSKVILAMAAMGLRDDGVIDLDADISRYWGAPVRNPNYRNIPVTARHILSHTSSIKAYEDAPGMDGSSIRANLTSGAAFNRSVPGSIPSWCYNNYAFAVLGLTLELAAGETVNSIADKKLFEPLGISASFGLSPSDDSPLATLYNHDGTVAMSPEEQKRITAGTSPGQSGQCLAGGLMISAADLAKLVAVLANDGVYEDQQVLSPEAVALMESLNTEKVPQEPFYQCYPLRYQTRIYHQDSLYYHTGSSYGAYHCLSYNPATKNGVVVLTTGAGADKDAYGIYKVCGDISDCIYTVINDETQVNSLLSIG